MRPPKVTMFLRKQRSAILDQVWNFLESSRLRQIRETKREVDVYNPRFFKIARLFRVTCDNRMSLRHAQQL